jgi:hypothetical protein
LLSERGSSDCLHKIATATSTMATKKVASCGTPLVGLAVKVIDGFFLFGLSNAGNVQLLKKSSWLHVPVVYTNQRRAIIAIEKGGPGERVFNEAFAAWEPTAPSASTPSATHGDAVPLPRQWPASPLQP